MTRAGVLRIAMAGFADSARRLGTRHGLPALPATEWLMARGTHSPIGVPEWRSWLLSDAGLGVDVLERFPAGPCVHAAGSGHVLDGTWACAEPVHLLTAIDHLQLAAPVPVPLDTSEQTELLEALNRHFAGTGFSLHATGRGGWLCACPGGLRCTAAEPIAALGRNLRDLLPVGADAARLRAFVNEAQMLLHGHSVNERRANRGEAPVNSVWLWGIGAAGVPAGTAAGVLVTDDDWLAGLWRLHGGAVRTVAELAQALEQEGVNVRVAIAPDATGGSPEAELGRLEHGVFAPLRTALLAQKIRVIGIHRGDAIVQVGASARWKFWRRARPLAGMLA